MSKNNTAVATAAEVTADEITRQAFLAPFNDNRPWDEVLISTEIKSLVRITDTCIFEAGRRLIFARNNVPQGRWLQFLESCSVSSSTAARYMLYARKALEMPRFKQLEAAGISKLDEILRADDADLQDFEDSGVFLGKTGDELAAMTRDELKALVRKKEKALAENEQRLGEARKQFETQQQEIDRLKGGPIPQEEFLRDLQLVRGSLMNELSACARHCTQAGYPHTETIAAFLLLDQIKGFCTYLQEGLQQSSPVGSLLQGCTASYNPDALRLNDLAQTAKNEARELGLVDDDDSETVGEDNGR